MTKGRGKTQKRRNAKTQRGLRPQPKRQSDEATEERGLAPVRAGEFARDAKIWGVSSAETPSGSRPEALAGAVGRANYLYTLYVNCLHGRTGHLWQSRFHPCALDEVHAWRALRSVERNPVRAKLVRVAWRYRWSNAAASARSPWAGPGNPEPSSRRPEQLAEGKRGAVTVPHLNL